MASERHEAVDKVAVFDLDGVLLQTFVYEWAQNMTMLSLYNQLPVAADERDIVVPPEIKMDVESRMERAFFESNGDPVRHYQTLLGQKALGSEFRDRHRFAVERNRNLVLPEVGAEDLLEDIAADPHMGVALWTSRDRSLLTPELVPEIIKPADQAGPREEGFFDITITADDVGYDSDGSRKMKPNEAGLEIIANHYSLPYERFTMIGDRPSDIIPAIKLGAHAIGFASGYIAARPELLWNAGASHVVRTHDELRPLLVDKNHRGSVANE
jgi:phosphoglycolate phosphatase-like HAD superfamily hydrolase